MSIGKRLVWIIAIALLSLIGIGVLGVVQFRSINANMVEINQKAVPALVSVAGINDNFKEIRALLLAFVMEEDEDIRKGFGDKIAAEQNELGTQVTAFQQTGGSGELSDMASGYSASVKRVMQLTQAGKKDEAQLELYSKAIPAEQKLGQLLTSLKDRSLKRQNELKEASASTVAGSITAFITIIALTLIAVSGLGYFLHRSIMRPLAAMQHTVAQVASQLDFKLRAPVLAKDEVGAAVGSFNTLLDTVQQSFREISEGVLILNNSVAQLTDTAHEIRQVSAQTSEASTAVSSTVEEMTVSITHVAQEADQAETQARQSGAQANSGGAIIHNTIGEIQSIASAVENAARHIETLQQQSAAISSVVNVIKEVADQTNLLALNAAIEAARAGEQGRGFAVVADEVRKLAERTASSTQEISGIIGNIQQGSAIAVESMQQVVSQVHQGVANANQAADAVAGIRQASEQVVGRVAEISLAIREQSSASTHIARQVERLATISEEASNAVELTSQSADQLQSLANKMKETISRYRI